MTTTTSLRLALPSLILAATAGAAAIAKTKSPKAHEHGMAKLDVAIDGNTLSLELEVPGDGIFGFEHKPKTDADKATVAKAMKTLKEDAATLFVLPPELGCKATDADIEASQAQSADAKDKDDHPSAKAHSHGGHEHADVEAGYTFECTKSPAGAKLRLGLLKAFPRIGKVKVQIATATGQSSVTASSDQDAIAL